MTATLSDAALPGLPAALDPDVVREALARALESSGRADLVERLGVLDVQYRPGERCVVAYGLKLRSEEGARSRRAWLAGWLHARGAEAPPLPPERAEGTAPGAEPPDRLPCLRLEALSMTLFPFPVDPALPGLAGACDPLTLRTLLGRRWSERRARVRSVRVDRLGHVPGARAALAIEVLGEARGSGEPELRHLVGKMDASRGAANVFARGWAVWRAAAGRVRIAPPVGFVPSINLSLQERVPGERLSEHAGSGSFVGDARRTATLVAALHGLSVPLGSTRDPSKDVRSVERWGALLAAILPGARRRIERHAARLSAELAARGTITGPVHGDLHPSNVLVDDGRVTLIDLDNMARGDRLVDVGRFVSSLRTSALRVSGDAEALRPAGEAFLEAYLARTGEDERRARLYEAAALMVSAGSGFRLQRPGWQETADALLALSESALAAARRGSPVAVARGEARPARACTSARPKRLDDAEAEPGPERVDHAEPPPKEGRAEQAGNGRHAAPALTRDDARAWAGDGRLVLAAIAPRLLERFGVDATACEVARAVDGKRLHYRITGWRDDERVRRSAVGILGRKRASRAALRRLSVLRDALAGRPEALSIAAPLGAIPEIGLLLLDTPRGARLVPAAGALPELADLEGVGAALRALHETPVRLGRQRGVATRRPKIESLARRAEGLGGHDAIRARRLLEAIDDAPAPSAPLAIVLGRIDPRHVVRAGGRWTVESVTDVALGDPRGDLADLSAGLARLGLAAGRGVVPGLRERLRRAYAGGDEPVLRGLARPEAVALLHGALLEARRGGSRAARALLDASEERLLRAEREMPRFAATIGSGS